MSYRGAREACLETSRLYMRPTTNADGDGLYHVHRDVAVSLLLANVDQMSRSCSDHLLQGYVQHWRSFGCGFYLVFDRKEAASPPIGRCGLRITPDEEAELGYCFLAAATGRGVATEAAAAVVDRAFQTMSINQIVAFVRPENHQSMRVLTKLGFQDLGFVEQGRAHNRFILNRAVRHGLNQRSAPVPWS